MSMEGVNLGEPPSGSFVDSYPAESKPTYKSWKKKFRKMKYKFEQKMRESDQLFREEQRAHDTSRRLAEENDQLLDLLLDVNESVHIPPHHRFNLHSPSSKVPSSAAVPALEPDVSPSTTVAARLALEEAATELAAGHISAEEHAKICAAYPEATVETPFLPKPLTALSAVPHTTLDSIPPEAMPDDLLTSPIPATYLTPTQEDEYLYSLDTPSGAPSARAHPLTSKQEASSEREKDRDFALRNPVSVYNWLRRHQPQVFLQDNEGVPERTGAKSSRGAGKRASLTASTTGKERLDRSSQADASWNVGDDHSGVYAERETQWATPTEKGKRKKKDDDGGYRPKGGGGRPPKRKRESDVGAASGASGKKAKRVSGAGAPDAAYR